MSSAAVDNEKMSNFKAQMSNQIQNPNVKNKYDLAERTAKFGEDIIMFVTKLKDSPPDNAEECRRHWKETHEFALIFSSIFNKK